MSINYNEFLQQLQENKGSRSVDNLRNEEKQVKTYGQRIAMLKKEKAVNSRILAVKSIAIPFNPFTVQADEMYNDRMKFRTEKSATTTMLTLKMYYNQNEEAKQALLDKLNLESWDTSDIENITKEDTKVFKKYGINTIFTINQVHINNKAVTGRDNGADYKVDIPRDDVGNVLNKWVDDEGKEHMLPNFVKTTLELGDFFSSCYLEEYKEWERTEGVNKTDQDKSNKRMSIMGQSPISQDRPKNFILVLQLPMKPNSLDLDLETILTWEEKDFKKALKITPYTSKIRTTCEEYRTLYSGKDYFNDFYEIDMKVPNEEDAQKRGQDTSYSVALNSIKEIEEQKTRDFILNGLISVLDSLENIDKIVLASSYVSPLSSDVIKALTDQLKEEVDLSKLLITENTVNRFGGLISNVWGAKASGIITDAAMGELPEGNVTTQDLKENREELKNLMADVNEVDLDLDEE